jgi:HlyD family secretion protein
MACQASGVRGVLSALAMMALPGAVALPCASLAQSQGAFSAQGVVEPEGGVLSIGTAATGVVLHIVGGPGEPVRPGQELVRIDCAPLEASVRSLAGQSQAAQAVADRVRHGPRPGEIAVGEANVGVAKSRADEAADALRRAQGLQVGISVTQAVMLQIQRDARITFAQLEDARARLDLLRSGSREEDVTEADARRDAARAALEEAKARLAQCSVVSPIQGVVVARLVSQGQFVSAAVPTVLLEIEDDSSFSVRAAVEEAHLADLCLQQHASVALPGAADPLAATVSRIAPRIGAALPGEPGQSGTAQGQAPKGHLAVTLNLDRQKAGLIAGETVSVRFESCHP